MKKILFIQHGDVDGPGLLSEAGIDLTILHPYTGVKVPLDLEQFDGLVLGGGGQSAWEDDKYPYLAEECRLVVQALGAGKPVLGLCLGGQLIARALGARVSKAEKKELGFYPVTMAEEALADDLAALLPRFFGAAHWHGDVFEIPLGGVRLASSAMTPNQIFRMGRSCYGFQFHLEMTPDFFEVLVADSADWFAHEGVNTSELIAEARIVLPKIKQNALEFFKAWAALA